MGAGWDALEAPQRGIRRDGLGKTLRTLGTDAVIPEAAHTAGIERSEGAGSKYRGGERRKLEYARADTNAVWPHLSSVSASRAGLIPEVFER